MAPPEQASGRSNEREVEWQLDAVDLRPVRRWLEAMTADGMAVEPLGVRSLHDRYLDTADWHLHRAGYTLRIRTASRRSEATAKSRGTVAEGLRDRRELTEPLSSGDPHAVASAPGPVGELVRALAGSRPLGLLFEVRTRRRAYSLAVDGGTVGEVSLDDTSIPVEGGRPARLQRVEIEIDPEAVDAVAPLIDELRTACGLHPAAASKFQAGLLAAGLVPPPALDLGPVEIDDSTTIGELAFAVLRTQFREMLSHEPEARLGEDPEGVHAMRVAIRRMRAAMSVFREVLPVRAQRLRDEFKWLAGVLGDVRDLDVQLEQAAEWGSGLPGEDRAALGPLVATLKERRAAARSAMLHHLDSRRSERMMAGMSEMLVRGPLRRSRASRTPALVAGPELVRRRFRKVRKAGDDLDEDSPAEDLHALRIRVKRLRYAVEFLGPLHPKRSKRFVRRLVAIQDNLGELQDARVATDHIRELVESEGFPLRAVFVLGRISERYAAQAASLRAEFPRLYRRVRRGRWSRLRKAMDRRRAEVLATMPSPRPAPVAPAPQPPSIDEPADPTPATPTGGLSVVRS